MGENPDSSASSVNANGSNNGQSPINIEKRKAITKIFPPIMMSGYAKAAAKMTLTNTGHTAEIRSAIDGPGAYLSGGPLTDKYKFVQLHFHWGTEDSLGSEHAIDGKYFSMEAHIVHHNIKYRNIEESLKNPDGFAVVAAFFQLKTEDGDEDHSAIASITNHLLTAGTVGTRVEVLPDVLSWLVDHCLKYSEYYTYQGSLTTSPFTENVTWLVYPVPVEVSSRQIDVFRQLRESTKRKIVSNRRNTQLLGQRVVYHVKNDTN